MECIWRYFENEPKKWYDILRCFIFWLVLNVAYSFIWINFYLKLEYNTALNLETVLLAGYIAFGEEALFRIAPIVVLGTFTTSKKQFRYGVIFATILVSVIIFGYTHGGNVVGILRQGIGGLMLSIICLKFGAFNQKTVKPLFASFLCHWLILIIIYALPIHRTSIDLKRILWPSHT